MTEPAPDWVIRTANFPQIHQEPAKISQPQGLNQTTVDQFQGWKNNLAGKDALAAGDIPVAGSSVSGTVNANNLAVAPATSVGLQATNLLVSNNFTSPDSIATQRYWSWDGTDGNLTPGCAAVVCDGTQPDLLSNEVAVITGETVEVSCQVKWSDLVYTGSDVIALGVEKFRKGRAQDGGITYLDVGVFYVDSVASPAAASDWEDVSLAGTYVVEPGVDQLRFRLHAGKTITAGTVKWDEAAFLKLDLIDDAAVPGVGETIDDIVTRLFGTEGEGFTHNDSALALANTASALLSVNARLSALEAEGSTGVIAGDDFLWSGEVTAHANWGGAYSAGSGVGYYSGNGNDAVWTPSVFDPPFNIDQTFQFDWQGTGATSGTDYQLIQLLLSSAPVTAVTYYRSYIHLLGRISAGFGSYVRASICSDGTYAVDYWNGSTFTTMDSGFCAVPGMGTVLSFYCGDKSITTTRRFKLMANNTIISNFTEVGTGSPLGAGNRKWGWGGMAESGLYSTLFLFLNPAQGTPPTINQWLAYDQ